MMSTPAAVKVGRRTVGDGHPVYIIAEIGINHNGSLELARKLIDGAIFAGADAVIVSLHYGSEGSPTPDDYQRSVSAAVTASGQVDLIIGHHSHMVQPIEMVNGRWVVYSLGNFLSNMPANDRWTIATSDGVIVAVTLTQAVDGSVVVERPVAIPTWVDRGRGYVIRPVLTDLADPALPGDVRRDLEQSLERSRLRVGCLLYTSPSPRD